MSNSEEAKSNAVKTFAPAISTGDVTIFESLALRALGSAQTELLKQIEASSERTDFLARGWFDPVGSTPENPYWLVFGHSEAAKPNSATKSKRCFYSVTFSYEGLKLKQVEVRLFLCNPKFRLFDRGFSPALVNADFLFVDQSAGEENLPIGLAVDLAQSTTGDKDGTSLFTELQSQIGIDLNENLDPRWKSFSQEALTLTGRLDISFVWEDAADYLPGAAETKKPPRVDCDFAGKPRQREMSFFTEDGQQGFTGVVHESGKIGLHLDSHHVEKMAVVAVLSEPRLPDFGAADDEKQRWQTISTTLREFGLRKDFRGLIFGGLSAYWLDDSVRGADIELTQSLVALAFSGGDTKKDRVGFYGTVAGTIKKKKSKQDSFFKLLADEPSAKFKISIANQIVRECVLSATFGKHVDESASGLNSYAWLEGISAVFNLKARPSGNGGADGYLLDVETDAPKDGLIARVRASNVKLGQSEFTYLASLLTFAPILKLAAGGRGQASGGRNDFVSIGEGETIGALFAGAALDNNFFFKDVLKAEEMRVTGIRILSQPAANGSGRETALLFDFETLFTIEASNLSLKSERALSARVENSGISFRSDKFRWVQVPKSAFGVKVLDDSIWSLASLKNILGLKGLSFGIDGPSVNLGLDFGLNVNLGLLKAGDFHVGFDFGEHHAQSFWDSVSIRPSSLSIEIPNVLKGLGRLKFGEGKHDIGGFLDIEVLSTGLRAKAEARVATKEDKEGKEFSAFAADASVEFPTGVPLFGTGLQLKGVDFLFAEHFVRNEVNLPNGGARSLHWLDEAGGELVGSLTKDGKTSHQPLWNPSYGQRSFGLGALITLQTNDQLLNLNSMLVVDDPGSRITVFAKARLFKSPKSNQKTAEDNDDGITKGILGILQLNFADGVVVFAASVDIEFKDFAKFFGAIDTQFSFRNFRDWHYYVGREDKPVSGTLLLGGIAEVGAAGYVMVSGHDLSVQKIPGTSGRQQLPGLAVALGARAYTQISDGDVYLSVFAETFVRVSISKDLFVAGTVTLGGELFLFIAGIGLASGLTIEYYDSEDRGRSYSIHGSACGSIKVGFTEIEGCVSVQLGDQPRKEIALPPLVTSVDVIDGTDVALRGQGVDGTIDGTLANLPKDAPLADGAKKVPLDAVLAVSLAAAPATANPAAGFLSVLGPSATNTTFNYGTKTGGYMLTKVSLERVSGDNPGEIDYARAKAQWLRNTLVSGSQQALPVALGLLTRRPIGTPNALPSSAVQAEWIAALNQGLCEVWAPQEAMFVPNPVAPDSPPTAASGATFPFAGQFCSNKISKAIGNASIGSLGVQLFRPEANRSHIEVEVLGDEQAVAFLALYPNWPGLDSSGFTLMSEGFARDPDQTGADFALLELWVACEDSGKFEELRPVDAVFKTKIFINPGIDALPQGSDLWSPPIDSFLKLKDLPRYRNLVFARIQCFVDASKVPADGFPQVKFSWGAFREGKNEEPIGPMPLLIGGVRFLGSPEIERHRLDKEKSVANMLALQEFLAPRELVLDPNTMYQLTIGWETSGTGIAPQTQEERYQFHTVSAPPVSLSPYLMATYPAKGCQFLPYGHTPGFSIASGALLRVLARWTDLRIKVSVIDETGNPVEAADATAPPWSEGRLYRPTEILDAKGNLDGIDRKFFDGLPSALLRALKVAIANDPDRCIDTKGIELDCGVWIGIQATLKPLRGYTVRIDLTNSDGTLFAMEEGSGNRPHFFEWTFRTGLNANAEAAAKLFEDFAIKRRLLSEAVYSGHQLFSKALEEAATEIEVDTEYLQQEIDTSEDHSAKIDQASRRPKSNYRLHLIPDQVLEDILALHCGERLAQRAEAETYMLLRRNPKDATTVSHAIVLRARDPLLLETETAKIVTVKPGDVGQPEPADMLELGSVFTRYPRVTGSVGIDKIYASTSGTMVVALLTHDVSDYDKVEVSLHEIAPRYLPFDGAIPQTSIKLARTKGVS